MLSHDNVSHVELAMDWWVGNGPVDWELDRSISVIEWQFLQRSVVAMMGWME